MNTEHTPSVSIVIPVLNAARHLPTLLPALRRQAPRPPAEIILVDSGSTDGTADIAAAFDGTRVVTLDRFTHGRSRNRGAREATGDIVVFVTQDALPKDDTWLARLVAPLGANGIVATCSRQEPRPDATPMERFFLLKRFPAEARVWDLKRLDGKVTYERVLFSDVSGAVERRILLEFPYDETLIMSEDQQLARDLVRAGHAMAYVPESVVIHSHRYSLKQTFKRYFDGVYALSVIFPDQTAGCSVRMGLSYVREELGFLARTAPAWLLYYPAYVAVKAASTLLAHRADRLPPWVLRHLSMHAYHWERP